MQVFSKIMDLTQLYPKIVMFFGAGNLIFPVHMGQEAGSQLLPATIGFLITGIGLPFLGIVSIGISGSSGLQDLASRVHPAYAKFMAGQEAGAGLYEVGLGLYGCKAGFFYLLQGEGVCFKDDLYSSAVFVAYIGDCPDVPGDILPAAAAYPAVVRHDIQFLYIPMAAVGFGLQYLGGGGAGSKGKIADHADSRGGSPGEFSGNGEGGGIDADRGAAILYALQDITADLCFCEFRFQHRLIDIGGQFFSSHFSGFFYRMFHALRFGSGGSRGLDV